MKTVELTQYECELIDHALNSSRICTSYCYCNYKSDMCDKLDKDGNPRCKLKAVINRIIKKLGMVE